MKVDLAVAAVVVAAATAEAVVVVAAATAEAVVVAAVATAAAVVAAATVEVAAAIARMVLGTITADLPISSFQKRPGEIRAVFFAGTSRSQGRGCWEPAAFRIPDALCRVSSHSFSGSDPAVIPAPTWKAASPSRMTTVLMAMLNWVRPS